MKKQTGRPIKNLVHRLTRNEYLPFIVLFLLMLILHLQVPIPRGDDVDYTALGSLGLNWQMLAWRYNIWTSRLILEGLTVLFLMLPHAIWRILNPLVYSLLALLISKLVVESNKTFTNWFLAFLMLIYPISDIANTGWVTTTIIYLWPLTAAVWVILLLRRIIQKKKIRAWEFWLSVPVLLLAINLEFTCILLALIFAGAIIFLRLKKSPHWFPFAGLLACMASLLFILLSPGNAARNLIELRWFQDFQHISWIEKLEIGLSSTAAHYFDLSTLFIVLCVLLLLVIMLKSPQFIYRMLASIPLMVVFFLGILPNALRWISTLSESGTVNSPVLRVFHLQMSKYGLLTLENFTKPVIYLQFVLLYSASYLVVLLLFLAFRDPARRWLAVGIFCVGSISRIMMFFIPTIWASGTRTFIFLSVSMIMCCLLLFQEIQEHRTRRMPGWLMAITGLVAICSHTMLLLSTLN